MKKRNNNIDREVEQVIHSGLNNNRVQTSPFFTTRVMGRVEQLDSKSDFFNRLAFVVKPAFAVVILINVINFFLYRNTEINVYADNTENQYELVMGEYSSVSADFIVSDDFLTAN
ncbi:hypothetical protein E9993_01180 [Labilibacter sediminis]|nr:hypothetical protein E9993_01180 [Labilibacter sediminis]